MRRKTILIYFLLSLILFFEIIIWKFTKVEDYLLVFLLVDILIFCGLAIYDMSLCFNLVILILPVKNILLTYEIGTVTFDIYTAGIAGLFLAYFAKMAFNRRILFILKNVDVFLILFSVYCLTFFLTSNDIIQSGFVYFHSIFIPVTGYILVRYCISDFEKYKAFKYHVLATVSGYAVWAIVTFISSGSRIIIANISALQSASFFALAFFLTFVSFKRFVLPLSVFYLSAFLMCFSRMYIINMIASPLYFVITKKGKVLPFFVGIVIITFGFTIGSTITFDSSKYQAARNKFYRLSKDNRDKITYTSKRMIDLNHWKMSYYGLSGMWGLELDRFKAKPILGNGIGSTIFKTVASSHNLHVQLLAYTGICGWILFHIFLISAFTKINRKSLIGKPGDITVFCIMAILIYNNGITNGLFHGSFNYLLFIMLALIQNLKDLKIVKKA